MVQLIYRPDDRLALVDKIKGTVMREICDAQPLFSTDVSQRLESQLANQPPVLDATSETWAGSARKN